ncbi:MAG TPA: alpha/beta hydrolase [Sedimenticola thiotaurini]|uniref:Alpha/beta hydrolase n=1 Tax=Sedimenticola thiotaurini TaxID=1543721 RepID=A0A831RJJ1_9GAMM|nr:alpha/beta hydrolase [Sedimenticola thiotaurini]
MPPARPSWSIWESRTRPEPPMKIALILLLGIALLNGFMYLRQPSMIFFPSAVLEQTPADWGLAYEDVFLQTQDGVRLHGWYIPREGADRTLLFFHGNAGNISHRGESVAIFHRLGVNLLIIDYRGYGRSQGSPGEQGLYDDARAAWHYLTRERGTDPGRIVLFGRSLGGAVAARLAAETDPAGLILESTFSSARDMATELLPLLSRLVWLRYRFDTLAAVGQRECPLLVLHSPDDEVIPFRLGQRIFQAAREPKAMFRMRGGHNSGFLDSQPEYQQALAGFLETIRD